ERPKEGAQSLVFYALMESPRLAGAYRFELHPGTQTAIDVRAKIYLRGSVTTLGVAPLTSMFYSGENQPAAGEFRPEVHDSDGLSIESSNGEWLWRPLLNPAKPITTSFSLPGIKGFGLMQRDRAFSSYEDVEARYDVRPSAWIVPNGDWGPGHLELVQLPTADETNDNIVAYWVPQNAPLAGQAIDVGYRILWQGQDGQLPNSAWSTQTRTGRGVNPLGPEEFQYVVDFTGPSLKSLPPDALVRPVVTANANAKLIEQNAYLNPATGGWRMTVHLQRVDPLQAIELRAFLQAGSSALTETWTTLIPPR
ncbi:MAG: putative periplasmic glucans biosynthesis signal peptide protein, partial [Rhizobacter sp.]|nr:putative periplasmic glucans biosynthesis signal peptide protein [Rhizobacter sp.]